MSMDSNFYQLHIAPLSSAFKQGILMDKPDVTAPENVRCRYWRETTMDMTREQLSSLTGFGVSAIRDFESTKDSDPMARKRYRMACAAAQFGIAFDWVDGSSMKITTPVEIRIGDEQ